MLFYIWYFVSTRLVYGRTMLHAWRCSHRRTPALGRVALGKRLREGHDDGRLRRPRGVMLRTVFVEKKPEIVGTGLLGGEMR